MNDTTFTAAVFQRPPVLLDREASMARVLEGVEEAADASARLVVFPETYLPGYPEYIWRLAPGPDYDLSRRPDIFALRVDRSPRRQVSFEDRGASVALPELLEL